MRTLTQTKTDLEMLDLEGLNLFTITESYKHSLDNEDYVCFFTTNEDSYIAFKYNVEKFLGVNLISYSELNNECELQVKGSDIRIFDSISNILSLYLENYTHRINEVDFASWIENYIEIEKEYKNILKMIELKDLNFEYNTVVNSVEEMINEQEYLCLYYYTDLNNELYTNDIGLNTLSTLELKDLGLERYEIKGIYKFNKEVK
jgi:hypothetical protein